MTASTFPNTVQTEPLLDAQTVPNSVASIRQRMLAGHIPALAPLSMSFIRLPLILLGQLLVYAYYLAAGHAKPWLAAAGMANFYLPLTADLVCLLLLVALMRRENLSISSLVGFDRRRLLRDVLIGLGLLLLTMIVFQVSSLIGTLVVYGPGVFANPAALQATDYVLPPRWVYWWSLLVLPITVGLVEELTYRGYVQPRLQARFGKAWLAILIMAVGFGAQHLALPLVDWQMSLSRFVGTFLAGLFFGWVYQRQQRLLPLIIAHWGLDFIGLGLLPLLMLAS